MNINFRFPDPSPVGRASLPGLALGKSIQVKPTKGKSRISGTNCRMRPAGMAENVAEEFKLDRLAAQAGLSMFYFNRLFKSATAVSPSHYLAPGYGCTLVVRPCSHCRSVEPGSCGTGADGACARLSRLESLHFLISEWPSAKETPPAPLW